MNYFVLNEAEKTLAPFLRDLAKGQARRVYASAEFPDINQTPAPLWELTNLKRYDTISVQFSRGCPFNCDFCNVTTLLGHRPRTKTVAQIIAELDSLYALGWRKGKTGMPFSIEASINLADDPELMHLMVMAGFDTVFVGIETPNEASLAEC